MSNKRGRAKKSTPTPALAEAEVETNRAEWIEAVRLLVVKKGQELIKLIRTFLPIEDQGSPLEGVSHVEDVLREIRDCSFGFQIQLFGMLQSASIIPSTAKLGKIGPFKPNPGGLATMDMVPAVRALLEAVAAQWLPICEHYKWDSDESEDDEQQVQIPEFVPIPERKLSAFERAFDGLEHFFQKIPARQETAPLDKPQRGRKPDPDIDPKADQRLCNDWKAAKGQGMTRKAFTREKGLSVSELVQAMDRERWRRRSIT